MKTGPKTFETVYVAKVELTANLRSAISVSTTQTISPLNIKKHSIGLKPSAKTFGKTLK